MNRAEHNAAVERANGLPAGTLAAYGRATTQGRKAMRKKWPGVRALNRQARDAYRAEAGLSVDDADDEGEASASSSTRWLALGAVTRLLVPDQAPIACRYAVARVGDLIASHDPSHGFSPNAAYPWRNSRDYQAQPILQRDVWKHAAELSPAHLLDLGGSAENGPPVVDDSGAVAGGNSRAMKLAIACRRGGALWDDYRAALAESLGRFGLPVMDWPRDAVVVRVLPSLDAATLDRLIPLLNESAARADSKDEGAFALARGLDDASIVALSAIRLDGDTTLRQALKKAGVAVYNRIESNGGIPTGRRNCYVDDVAGNLTDQGLDALERAIMAKMTGGNLDTFKGLPAGLRNVAIRAAGPLLELKAAVAEGLLPPCADLTAAFDAALRQAAERGENGDQAVLFGSAFADGSIEEALGRLVATLARKRAGMESGPHLRELSTILGGYRADLGQDAFGAELDEEGVVEVIRSVEQLAA